MGGGGGGGVRGKKRGEGDRRAGPVSGGVLSFFYSVVFPSIFLCSYPQGEKQGLAFEAKHERGLLPFQSPWSWSLHWSGELCPQITGGRSEMVYSVGDHMRHTLAKGEEHGMLVNIYFLYFLLLWPINSNVLYIEIIVLCYLFIRCHSRGKCTFFQT